MNKKTMSSSVLSLGIACLILATTFVAGASAQDEKAEELRRTKIAKAQKALAGTTWTVITTLQDTKRPEEGTETFAFTERRVTTQNLANQGYGVDGSNYSVYVEADGAIVWETMLKGKAEGDEALLRGDLRGDVMTGVIDIQPARGTRKVYYFTSQKVKPAAAVEAPAPTTETTTPTPETKKRRWGF